MNRRKTYDGADWSKTNLQLARLYSVTPQAIAAARRVRGKPAHSHGGVRTGAGRPAMDQAEKRGKIMQLNLRVDQHARFMAAAQSAGMKASPWAVSILEGSLNQPAQT